jgi:hypothetical protein
MLKGLILFARQCPFLLQIDLAITVGEFLGFCDVSEVNVARAEQRSSAHVKRQAQTPYVDLRGAFLIVRASQSLHYSVKTVKSPFSNDLVLALSPSEPTSNRP